MEVLIGAGLLAIAWAAFYFFVLDKKHVPAPEQQIKIINKTPENIFMDIADLANIDIQVSFGNSPSAKTHEFSIPLNQLNKVKKSAAEEIKKLMSITDIDFSQFLKTSN